MATGTEPKTSLKPPLTVQQWGELDGSPRYDLVEGMLREKPDVALWHEVLLNVFSTFVTIYVRTNRLGAIVASNAKLKISDFGGREPDLFFIPNDQFHLARKNLFKGIPPLVVEVLSPTNARTDRVEKFREYAGLGVPEYWIIDFFHRCIEIYRLKPPAEGVDEYELAETVAGEDAAFRPALFPGLEIPLGEVWPTEFEHLADE